MPTHPVQMDWIIETKERKSTSECHISDALACCSGIRPVRVVILNGKTVVEQFQYGRSGAAGQERDARSGPCHVSRAGMSQAFPISERSANWQTFNSIESFLFSVTTIIFRAVSE